MNALAETTNGITCIQEAPASSCSGCIAILAATFPMFSQVYQANGEIVAYKMSLPLQLFLIHSSTIKRHNVPRICYTLYHQEHIKIK
jgi:hypothetical protein